MANELQISASLRFKKQFSTGGFAETDTSDRTAVTVNGEGLQKATIAITAAENSVLIFTGASSVSTVGYVFVRNLSASGVTVKIGVTTGVYTISLNSMEFALFRANASTLFFKGSAAGLIEYTIIED